MEIDTTLQRLQVEANQSWQDTNNLLLSHLLKYDQLLTDYLADMGTTIQAKREEVWECTWTVVDAIAMSLQAHLSLALDMLERLPTTPTGLAFTSRIPLLMVHSPEALAYQGEGMGSNDFQLLESSTVVVVLNQKLQQLLTVPMTAAAPNSRHLLPS